MAQEEREGRGSSLQVEVREVGGRQVRTPCRVGLGYSMGQDERVRNPCRVGEGSGYSTGKGEKVQDTL